MNPCVILSETYTSSKPAPSVKILRILNSLRKKIIKVMKVSNAGKPHFPGDDIRSGISAFRQIERESTFDGQLPLEKISQIFFNSFGIELTKDECNALKLSYENMNSNIIYCDNLISLLRGDILSPRHRELVDMVFEICDELRNGYVTEEDINHVLKSADVADHLHDEINPEEASTVFIEGLKCYSRNQEAYVLSDFYEYYRDVQAEIKDNTDFERLLRVMWGI